MSTDAQTDRFPLARERLEAFAELLRLGAIAIAKLEHDIEPEADADFDLDDDLDDDDPNYDEDVAEERSELRRVVQRAEEEADELFDALQSHEAVALAAFLGHGQSEEAKKEIDAALMVVGGKATFYEELAKALAKQEPPADPKDPA